MKKMNVLYKQTGLFSNLMLDYMEQAPYLDKLYHLFPTFENAIKQAKIKQTNYTNRALLHTTILKQYEGKEMHESVAKNIDALQAITTFTITTGHQLNLFTGPLYFIYKILDTIVLTEKMNQNTEGFYFVPIYWMATEDHDFEEINHFHYEGKTIRWNDKQGGVVGEYTMETIYEIEKLIESILPKSEKKTYILSLFQKSYLEAPDLATATHILVNELFAQYGLVIIDGNHPTFKQCLKKVMYADIVEQQTLPMVERTATYLKANGYKVQVNPRAINFFYITKNQRNRIIETAEGFSVLDTTISFTKEEMIREIEAFPERFSPNVLLRPLYQEIILPNIAYVGGGGEIAYWLEIKEVFDAHQVLFPMLKLRNSVLLLSEKNNLKLEKLSVAIDAIFLSKNALIKKIIEQQPDYLGDVSVFVEKMKAEVDQLKKQVQQVDANLLFTLSAFESRWEKDLERLEKKMLNNYKKKNQELITQIEALLQSIQPDNTIQERWMNITEMLIKSDLNFVDKVKNSLIAFEDQFVILTF